MRYTDNRLFPRIRDRMRGWIHQDNAADNLDQTDSLAIHDADDDSELAWRQYIL